MNTDENQNIIQLSKNRCRGKVWHTGPFNLDELAGTVQCGACETYLASIQVLKFYAREESQLNNRIINKRELIKKLDQKMKCKCEHCGEMTVIDRSVHSIY